MDTNKQNSNHDIDKLLEQTQLSAEILNIDTQKQWEVFTNKVNTYTVQHPAYFIISAAAAVLFIMFALWIVMPKKYVFQADKLTSITLKDSTIVTLDKDSKLIVKSNFNRKKRIVELQGKAYFQVAHNPNKPFYVEAGDFNVQVLGTKFIVSTLNKNVAVIEGIVKVQTSQKQIRLTKGQQANIQDANIDVKVIDDPNLLAWKNKSLKFNASSLSYVANTLTNTFNQKVIVQKNIDSLKITATFQDQNLEQILNVVCATLGIKYQLKSGTYILYK